MREVIHLVADHDSCIECLADYLPARIHKSIDLYAGGDLLVRVHYVTLNPLREDLIAVAAVNAAISRNVPAMQLRRIKRSSKKAIKKPPVEQLKFDFDL